jgi:hypothetical protein
MRIVWLAKPDLKGSWQMFKVTNLYKAHMGFERVVTAVLVIAAITNKLHRCLKKI